MNEEFLKNYKLEGHSLSVLKYPDPILSKKAVPVTDFNDDLAKTCKDMLFTMYRAPGIGLAAPQVGISKRFFVLDVEFEREEINNSQGDADFTYSQFAPQIFINPKITKKEGEILYQEGCLSVPGIYEDVKRYERITVEYQNLAGDNLTIEAEGILAICIQHENDRLDGIVFIERLSGIKKNFYKKKLEKEKKRKAL